jgi:hypothetical protein
MGTTTEARQLGAILADQVGTPPMRQLFEIVDVATQRDTVTLTMGLTDTQLVSVAKTVRAII